MTRSRGDRIHVVGVGDAEVEGETERQQEAVETAVAVGYYDVPRTATHEDVAAELACAPSTASEHLRKAESKVLQSRFGE
ncbi:helix-turn-helix domain-containing protein [Halorussus sp. MSC15.2]|uniref:helix-turn-helix domain-containing protein n=1 Tax=Halorussus sp. MSC15.2 TaxID=2283638 RepID=UPI0013D52A91|nr:helix-turn-helix domain-containing protein [Halorussus sp. MSC15.2]